MLYGMTCFTSMGSQTEWVQMSSTRSDATTSLHAIWSQWPRWSPYAAAFWTFGYAVLGLYWSVGGHGFPFGREHDYEAEYSVLAHASPGSTAPVMAALGLVGGLVTLAMAHDLGRGGVRIGMAAFGWFTTVALSVVFTDLRILMLITRVLVTPLFLVAGVPGGGSVADFYTWPRINLLVLLSGGMLWAAATVVYLRRGAHACVNCGRGDVTVAQWATPSNALRWGRVAVFVAMAVPLVYAVSRVAMALGSPIGVPQSFYDEMKGTGVIFGELFMASLATIAAVLSLGLVRRWGETFPRWVWFRAGERVPPQLAIIPSSIMSVVIMSAGVSGVRSLMIDGIDAQAWAITGPQLLWPLWGLALAVATYAYYLRRRSRCRHCGRGSGA